LLLDAFAVIAPLIVNQPPKRAKRKPSTALAFAFDLPELKIHDWAGGDLSGDCVELAFQSYAHIHRHIIIDISLLRYKEDIKAQLQPACRLSFSVDTLSYF
jgi:hypothetical protein